MGRDQDKIDGLQWSYLDAATWSSILKEFEEFVVTVKFPDMKTTAGNRADVSGEPDGQDR